MSNQRLGSPPASSKKQRRGTSIKSRIVRVALIPSIALVVLWIVAASYLLVQGVYAREVAKSVRQVSIPAVAGLASIQKERQLSMAQLAKLSQSREPLVAQRLQSDKGLNSMRAAAAEAMSSAPQTIKTQMQSVTGYLDKLPMIRAKVDGGDISKAQVFTFYNSLLDAAIQLFYTQARIAPDVTASQGGFAATDLFRLSDLMSRASSQAAGAFAAKKFSESEYLSFVTMVGAYHSQLTDLEPNLLPDVRTGVRQLLASDSWNKLVAAENALLAHGVWSRGVPDDLPINETSWATLTNTVSAALIDLAKQQAGEVSTQALADGNTQMLYAMGGSIVALAVVALAIVWGLRQAGILANQTLLPAIRRLGDRATTVVQDELPSLLARLAAGERVDLRETRPHLTTESSGGEHEPGEDEIAKVARVIDQSMSIALDAAVKEARARDGVQTVFLGIAYRNQRPLQQALIQLDEWEQRETDPERLSQWFTIHHLITQVRGVIESLIILGGGQPGRRWRQPQPVRDVLRAAISQSDQYNRISLQAVPDIAVVSGAVAGTIHLITQLLNNAVAFSSPTAPVMVRSLQVGTGLVVEVEDQGMGMPAETRQRVNDLLREAPDFDITALGDGSQLGFWVIAQLATRMGISVEMRSSPYGGELAIVLIPTDLLAPVSGESDDRTEVTVDRREETAVMAGGPPTLAAVGQGQTAHTQRAVGAMPQHQGMPVERRDDARQYDAGRHLSGMDGNGQHLSKSQPLSRRPASSGPPPSPAARPPLPERQPQQHLVPQLCTDEPTSAPQRQDVDLGSADEARDRLRALQKGTRAGRAED